MEIYSNPRAWRVRVAQATIWIIGAMIVWMAFFSDGPVGSAGEQIFVWVIGALVALVMAGTDLYMRAYVLELRLEGGLRITTLTFFGQRSFTVDPALVRVGQEKNDFLDLPFTPLVDNYWMPMRVPGQRMPLIVDTTAASLDVAALERGARRRK